MGRYGKIRTDEFIGKHSGLYFEIMASGKLGPLSPEDVRPDSLLDDEERVEMKTNNDIFDDNQSQKLTTEAIEAMKAQQHSGSTIVESIVSSSENFGKKNLYSKEKYIKRKQQKFLKWVLVRLPTVRLLAEHFCKGNPGRILDLRIDTMAQLLGHANLFQGGRYLVWDETLGYVTGAMMSKIGLDEQTMLASLYTGPQLHTPFLQNYNFSEDMKRLIYPMSLAEVGPEPLPELEYRAPGTQGEPEHMLKHHQKFLDRVARRQRARDCFDGRLFTSLVIVCSEQDPLSMVNRLAPFLAPSGRLILYCRHKEPLIAAFNAVRHSQEMPFVDVVLTESWLRPYQTAAGRMHPEMSLNSSGAGFLLTATRVLAARP